MNTHTSTPDTLTPLQYTADTVGFNGFLPEDFEVFAVPEFAPRMARIRQCLQPKLLRIGEALAPRLSEALQETVYPHVARHLRRTVNPPQETWVAFARNPRAYKPFVHLRVTISEERIRVLVFCEDDAPDKSLFASNLQERAESLADHFAHHPHLLSFDLQDPEGHPLRGHALTPEVLRDFARRLQNVRGQHAAFGIVFHRDHPIVQNGPEFLDAVVAAVVNLNPLYQCGQALHRA
ncbi:MAG: DUF1054 family protein [Chloroherpetonaceae bacterium]|nr:DUF1054 domain-containing protein [Chthonomonadaceae bacterium]MDW8206775.1 DUF1054 family protein [Chloroherpetonaceae bacterium]